MSTINTSNDMSSLFQNLTGSNSTSNSGLDLTDYYAIKNGSYGKLMKAYYKNQDSEKKTESSGDSKQSLTLMKAGTDSLQKSVTTLMDESLWEKKKIKKKDEETGEEKEVFDYDWDSITKAVKTFVDDYNNVIGKAGDSDTKGVLRGASRMTSITGEMSKLLNQVGIKIGSDNKLSVDEEKLKSASIGTMKTLFTGMHSFADKIMQKATAIGRAAAGNDSTYTSNATYSDTLSKLVAGKVDEEI
ncbi:MAG: flagellar filament capping protein FliD [Lachnospiraceae bacterium]|nr:flagellar filament capping protein FliD [Lachnospiraceae bacterium]